MKFQPDTATGVNVITRHEPGRLWVGATPYTHSVLVPWEGEVLPWPAAAPEALTPAHFEQIAALRPEVVIFGSGARLRFRLAGAAAAADGAAHRHRDHGHRRRLPHLQRAGQRTPPRAGGAGALAAASTPPDGRRGPDRLFEGGAWQAASPETL